MNYTPHFNIVPYCRFTDFQEMNQITNPTNTEDEERHSIILVWRTNLNQE